MAFIVSAVIAVVNFVVTAVAPVVAFVKANIAVVAAVAAVVASPFIGSLFSVPELPPSGGSEADRQQGVLLTTFGSQQSIPVVYGYRKIGGNVTFAETGSTDNKYLWVAYVLSEGVIEGLRELFLDDHQLPASIVADLNAGKTVNITEGKYKDRVVLQFSPGVYFNNPRNSTVGTWSICKDAPSWKPSMVYNGLAVIFARYEWKRIETQEDADANPFGGSIPRLQACILGRKVATIPNASSNDYDNRTERYSTNPVECLMDYLSNPRYGKGLKRSDFYFPPITLAANKCNQRVEYVRGIYGPILTMNTVVDTSQSLMNNVKTMLAGFRGYMPFSQGQYKIRIEDAGNESDILSGSATIVRTFNRDNIVGSITYSSQSKSNKYNSVKIGYVDPDNKWSNQTVVYPESESDRQYYIDQDNGRENIVELFLPNVTNYAIAKDMARLIFNKSRFQDTCSFTADSSAIDIEVGDNIRIQSDILNFTTTPWRVVSINIKNDMSVDLGCVRNPDFIYPHVRVGEEDIVEPVFVPRGATIYYPAVQSTVPVGLVPPTHAVWPTIFEPPRIIGINPSFFNSPGINTVTVFGINFKTGITGKFVGNDGTEYAPSSFTRNSDGQVSIGTVSAMTSANQPYDIVVVNDAAFGGLSSRLNNCLNVDGTTPPNILDPDGNPGEVDPPVVIDPDDPTITPNPTDPPTDGGNDNNDPTTPPEELPLTDVVTIEKFTVVTSGNLSYIDFEGTQPENPAYDSLKIYYKHYSPSETVYQSATITTRPGPGQTIRFRIGPLLPNLNYVFISRVRYIDGDLSSRVNKFFVTTTAGGFGDPRDFTEQASTGWPVDPGEYVSARDNAISDITALTLTTTGVPRDPRELSVTIKQNIFNEAANYDIKGVVCYSKSITETAWQRNAVTFDDSYIPGSSVTFTHPGDLGFRSYPSTPTANQQNYDFIFRWLYKDGTESSRQRRIMRVPVEVYLGSYTFNPFITVQNVNELVTDYFITLADPGAPAAVRDMTVNILGVGAWAQRGTNEQRFYIQPPNASVLTSWGGVRFRSRPVIPGSNPPFEEYIETSTYITPSGGNAFYIVPTKFDQDREWVVTPMYREAGVRKDSTQSWYGKGYVANRSSGPDVPTVLLGDNTPNWYGKFNWRQISTADALNTIDDEFPAPANPRVQVLKYNWNSRYNQSVFGWDDHWCEIEFDHRAIPNYTGLDIYRRYRNQNQMDNSFIRERANVYGLGRWEKIQVNTINNSGSVTVRLRPAEDFQIFNLNFITATGITAANPLFSSLYNPATHFYVGRSGTNVEILLVARTNAGVSTVGMLLPLAVSPAPGSNSINQLIGVRPQEVNLSDYNGYNSILQRNFNQSVNTTGKTLARDSRENAWPVPAGLSLN